MLHLAPHISKEDDRGDRKRGKGAGAEGGWVEGGGGVGGGGGMLSLSANKRVSK